MRLAAAAGAALIGMACASPAPPGARGEWSSPIARGHPLVGRMFEVASGRELSEADLLAALAHARFVLLGESHENADHHRLQARLIGALAAAGEPPAVAFEMLRADQQPALDALLAGPAPSAESVREGTGWDRSGWPDFALYAPVFEAALAAGLPLVAADLSREERTLLASDEPVPALLRARLGLDEPLPDDVQRALERDLLAAHCGELPESVLPRLLRVQRGRDAALAQALLAAAGDGGGEGDPGGRAVLVAGAEHVRRDRGAAHALARLAPGADLASLAFLEVDPEREDATADLRSRYGSEPVFDYVWYTPRASDEDPCERLRRPRGGRLDGGEAKE